MNEILLLFLLVHSCYGVIDKLNDDEYALMPPVFHIDDQDACFQDPGGLYCYAYITLVSDEPSPVLTMIQEYSEHVPSHFNHTLLRHFVCITRTCEKFYTGSEDGLESTLEACYNETLYDKYKLRAKVSKALECSKHHNKNRPLDDLEIYVAVLCLSILLVNIVATVGDYLFENGKNITGLRYLYCFSMFRNWKQLIAPAGNKDPKLQGLKGLHGYRAITMMLVILSHGLSICVLFSANTDFMEQTFSLGPLHMFISGTVVMQTFLIISSFLLVYHWLIYSETKKPSWNMLPKMYFMRWLRLIPSYCVILALTATWFGRLSSGPTWPQSVGIELSDCRRTWWKHLLFINNYDDTSTCMLQAWYLGADTQLYFVACIVFMLCRDVRNRKLILGTLFGIGVLIPALHTYFQDLDGFPIICPELVSRIFMDNPTFDEVYKRGHTNICGYIIGMAMGYMFYDWQKNNGDPKIYRKYRFVYWALFPIACASCYTGTIFFSYPPPSALVNMLYAIFLKPVNAIIFTVLIYGTIIQFEGFYRGILAWPGWTIPSRLSFSAFLLHIALARNYVGQLTSTPTNTSMSLSMVGPVLIAISYIAGFVFWMLVEAPFGNLVREIFSKPKLKIESKDAKDSKKDRSPAHKKSTSPVDTNCRKRIFDTIVDKKANKRSEKKR